MSTTAGGGWSRPRKRRDRVPPSLLADAVVDVALTAALRPREDTAAMDWFSDPDFWLEFTDEEGATLAVVGLLGPDWLRCEPHGDLRLADPSSLAIWMSGHLGVFPDRDQPGPQPRFTRRNATYASRMSTAA